MLKLRGEFESRRVWLNDIELHIEDSLKARNHSPTGFGWSYAGSGPSQLALAICLRLFKKEFAMAHYQNLKWDLIATLPPSDFSIDFDIGAWARRVSGLSWTSWCEKK